MISPAGTALDAEGPCEVLVLGIGNLLWADEGFGVRCVERLACLYEMAPGVRLMDGGTQGLYLVQYVTTARRLIVFDAIDYDQPPGTLRVVHGDAVPRFMGCRKMSLHQTGFQDVLAAADLLGSVPEAMALIGVQAEHLDDWGGPLRPSVAACLEPALDEAVALLAAWGFPCRRRAQPLPHSALLDPSLERTPFERAPLGGGSGAWGNGEGL
ncbi:HyaD/HybD family hydrogenase maturation endopeptidase [Pararhodospirillum photometricum]|uniref:Hydrogenase expression/formation protein HupD n=1 Tax=Pararhodospirillum photometricum DSM 122 TaxID=1150469 RepID=H6SN23_PARPM|nr:HyaD/HybD family hydrogenase maturation endopeptidase [Pararhodospirillum photometricum]CCG06899.1 HyaD peptidase. Aspartic peptidase. MEROPS family A31 [Pararhodospirillum photometricum DSM 122]